MLSHFVVPSLPLSYFSVLPQSFPSELLLYIMKKVELVVCFLIWYCSRNGAVLLGTQKAGGRVCVFLPRAVFFFSQPFGISRPKILVRNFLRNLTFFALHRVCDFVSQFRSFFRKLHWERLVCNFPGNPSSILFGIPLSLHPASQILQETGIVPRVFSFDVLLALLVPHKNHRKEMLFLQ